MAISEEVLALLAEESSTLKEVLESLRKQLATARVVFSGEEERTRELTADLVATRRLEDKVQLISDEAVFHALKTQKGVDIKTLERQIPSPYFARIKLREEVDGKEREFEYRIGSAANGDCRIVDWRKAPLSKLYYEYREGDEYSEEIQGRERHGTVTMRNRIEIKQSQLMSVECRHGVFNLRESEWHSGAAAGDRKSYGELPGILALISAEQFRSITEDAKSAVLIQGIAGSGKTTVALHRLSWLINEAAREIQPADALVLCLSPVLKRYIINSLPQLELETVKVRTYEEWAASQLSVLMPQYFTIGVANRALDSCPHGIERVKRSLALLRTIEALAKKARERAVIMQPTDLLLDALNDARSILEHDETKLLDRELISQTFARTQKLLAESTLDDADDALLLRINQISNGINSPRLKHLVVDEVQDLSPPQLATLIASVESANALTLVGDVAQQLDRSASFPGWDKLRRYWDLKDSIATYVTLSVSHRSSLPIMRLADHVQRREATQRGRAGRVPIWFRARGEQLGVGAAIEWLEKAVTRYPTAITAVLCGDMVEAKYALGLLRPTFGDSARLGDPTNFDFAEGIIVSTARAVKGLEFCNVLLWNPSAKRYPDSALSQNELYVAITRAEENLCIVTWQRPSPLLPGFGSILIRGIEVEPEEQDEPTR